MIKIAFSFLLFLGVSAAMTTISSSSPMVSVEQRNLASASADCKIKKVQMYARNEGLLEAFQAMIGEFGTQTMCSKDDSGFQNCDLDYRQLAAYDDFLAKCENSTGNYLYEMPNSFTLSDCSTKDGVVTTTYQVAFNISNAVDCFPVDVCTGMEESATVSNVESNMEFVAFQGIEGLDCQAKKSSTSAAPIRGGSYACMGAMASLSSVVFAAAVFSI